MAKKLQMPDTFPEDAPMMTTDDLEQKYGVSRTTVSKWRNELLQSGKNAYYRQRFATTDCKFNNAIMCDDQADIVCAKCGWNPERQRGRGKP